MKVDLKDVRLGVSQLTNTIYAFVPDKTGAAKDKIDVTEQAIMAVYMLAKSGQRLEIEDKEIGKTVFLRVEHGEEIAPIGVNPS